MEKITADCAVLDDKLKRLKQFMPEIFREGKFDYDAFKALYAGETDERPERYSFTWAGRREATRLLQAKSRAALVPAKEESVNFADTKNLFIEGDNLEVLKLLRNSYFNRVKMIYIDPPYNTGNDFIYPDDFKDPLAVYQQLTGQIDENGNALTTNSEVSGRYHSAWLTMMYPRLFIARQLLRDDGVMFISIDDNEVHNLRLIMNEIFGEENFIGCLIWKRRQNVDSRAKNGISQDHEYTLCYGKSEVSRIQGQDKDMTKYSNPDNDPRGDWMSDNMIGLATKEQRPNLHYDLTNPETGVIYTCPPTGWRYEKRRMAELIANKEIIWPQNPEGRPRRKKFVKDLESEFTGFSTLMDAAYNTQGTREVRDLFDGQEVFDFPKPTDFIKKLVKQGANIENGIVLDFFAGSATTAQAIWELNREDNLNRQYILVQLPENTDRENYSTIAEISKERIRRVIAKMQEDIVKDREVAEDLGFKVFKLAESHWKQWEGVEEDTPDAYIRQVEMFADPLTKGWSAENLIYEAAVKEGLSLNIRIEKVKDIDANAMYSVTDPETERSFYVCLDDTIHMEAVAALKLTLDDSFICRAIALDDTAAANIDLQCRLKTI